MWRFTGLSVLVWVLCRVLFCKGFNVSCRVYEFVRLGINLRAFVQVDAYLSWTFGRKVVMSRLCDEIHVLPSV